MLLVVYSIGYSLNNNHTKHYGIITKQQGASMNDISVYSTPDKLNTMLSDEKYIKEFSNYVIFDGLNKTEAWVKTFNVEYPLSPSMQTKMYRWIKKDTIQKWLEKANKSLEVDWIDKRVNALQHLYNIGMADEGKTNVDALDKFLSHLNREENKIKLDIGNVGQINIVQIVQEKLNMITMGATINPNGQIENSNRTRADNAIDAILLRDKK